MANLEKNMKNDIYSAISFILGVLLHISFFPSTKICTAYFMF